MTAKRSRMGVTLADVVRANPDLRSALIDAARRTTPVGRNRRGDSLYSETGLLTAAKVMSGRGVARETKGAGPGVEYR